MKKYLILLTFLLSTISLYSQKQFIETYGSELTLNCSNTLIFEILLRGNVTLSLSNTSGSKSITIWLVQDNIGSRTVSFSNQFTFTTLNTDSVTITANATTVLGFNINNNKTYCSYSSVSKGGSGATNQAIHDSIVKNTWRSFSVLNSGNGFVSHLDTTGMTIIRYVNGNPIYNYSFTTTGLTINGRFVPDIAPVAGDTTGTRALKVGDIFVDISAGNIYISKNTSRGGWVKLNWLLPLVLIFKRKKNEEVF